MPSSKWDTTTYDQDCSYISDYGKELVHLLNPKPGERILDLGCGTGHLTHLLSESGAFVTGLDVSVEMIEKARSLYPSLRFQISDIESLSVPKPCDGLFTNACLHWIKNPEAAITAMDWALRSGGRFVAEFGGHRNCQTIIDSLEKNLERFGYGEAWRNPWYFPKLGTYISLLEKQGFMVQQGFCFDRRTPIKDIKSWLTMFVEPSIQGIETSSFEQIKNQVELGCKSTLFSEGQWYADYVRLRIVATKP